MVDVAAVYLCVKENLQLLSSQGVHKRLRPADHSARTPLARALTETTAAADRREERLCTALAVAVDCTQLRELGARWGRIVWV